MIFQIKNKGQKSVFKIHRGYLNLDEGETIEIGDRRTADELRRHKAIEVVEAEPAEVEVPKVKGTNYGGYKIQELRGLAAHRGIKGSITMRKAKLIEELRLL